jgi:hypothetical protein
MNKLQIMFCVLFLFSSCISGTLAQSYDATVVIKNEFMPEMKCTFEIDDKEVANISGGDAVNVSIPPGNHTMKGECTGPEILNLILAGKLKGNGEIEVKLDDSNILSIGSKKFKLSKKTPLETHDSFVKALYKGIITCDSFGYDGMGDQLWYNGDGTPKFTLLSSPLDITIISSTPKDIKGWKVNVEFDGEEGWVSTNSFSECQLE